MLILNQSWKKDLESKIFFLTYSRGFLGKMQYDHQLVSFSSDQDTFH